jgi:hypothetical protein
MNLGTLLKRILASLSVPVLVAQRPPANTDHSLILCGSELAYSVFEEVPRKMDDAPERW